jgi:hypothetical protein
MLVPSITPINRIITVTHDLMAAILGVQEAPPNELQAIATLCHLLLGEVPPTSVPVDPPPIAPVPPPVPNTVDKEPMHIWDPNARQLQHVPHTVIPSINATPRHHAPGPNFINNDDDSPITPASCAAQEARTCAQYHTRQCIHLINSVITKALMPMIDLKPAASFPAHGYITATCALLKNTYAVIHSANSTVTSDSINFIGANVDDITGDVLEYCHLIKSNTHHAIWQKSFANKLGRLFQGICDIKCTDTCFFIRKKTNAESQTSNIWTHLLQLPSAKR